MKAVFLHEPGELVVNDVPTPVCGEGLVRIRVEAVGICDDDLDAWRGRTEYQRYPIILGRDAVGIVVESGGTATEDGDPTVLQFRKSLNSGDRVVLLPERIPLPEDASTCDGRHRGDHLGKLGFNVDGALREFIVLPETQCAVVPDNVTMKEAIFAQSVCKALNAVNIADPREDEVVAIMGAGDVGIITGQIVRSRGARPILVDTAQSRLELARSIGIADVINPFSAYAAEEIEWLTTGDMADAVIDTAGEAEGIGTCLQFAGPGGRVILTRKPSRKAPADLRYIIDRHLTVHSCNRLSCNMENAMQLLADGVVRVDCLISTTLPLEAAPLIIPSVARNPNHYMRVVLSNS